MSAHRFKMIGKNKFIFCAVTRYYQNGAIGREGSYKARKNGEVNWDIPHGNFRFYESDGRLEREGTFVNGEKDGIHTFYDRSGNLISQGNIFEDGSMKETLRKINQI